MEKVTYFGCYDYTEEWYMVEMQIGVSTNEIVWEEFVCPQSIMPSHAWPRAYLPQYLNEEGTARICDIYQEPDEPISPARVVFFIYRHNLPDSLLKTPYGDFDLKPAGEIPERLVDHIEFDWFD